MSGLWINKKCLHVAASPHGLVFGDHKNLLSIVEVKCLNIRRLHSVNDIINGDCQSAEVKQQCFVAGDKKLVLKKMHSYFYQIQLQLLVTEARFCDFVLYSAKGTCEHWMNISWLKTSNQDCWKYSVILGKSVYSRIFFDVGA